MSSVNDYAGELAGSFGGMSASSRRGDESPYDTPLATDQPKIVLMGPSKAGKSSIQRVVFQKMSPHETLFLETTSELDVKLVANNNFVQFQIWDLPGDYNLNESLSYGSQTLFSKDILKNCGAIVFCLDAQDEPYTDGLELLLDTMIQVNETDPEISFHVFIHKIDGDLFMSTEAKIECQNDIEQHVTKELVEAGLDPEIAFYPTSIYDHSIFDAFSRVVQKLIPQLATLENLLNGLILSCGIDKAFLFDVVSKVYIATDSNPVDVQSYELCSDMIDVVIDVSCIYGMKDEGFAYDSKSASIIRLSGGHYSGRVLYLREVSSYLALVCLLKEENFEKHGLIDFNIDAFKKALGKVFQVAKHRRTVMAAAGARTGAGVGAGAGSSTTTKPIARTAKREAGST